MKSLWDTLPENEPEDWTEFLQETALDLYTEADGKEFASANNTEFHRLICELQAVDGRRALDLEAPHNAAMVDAVCFGALIGYALGKDWPRSIEESGDWPGNVLAFAQAHWQALPVD